MLRVDLTGRIGWARRDLWTPAEVDRMGALHESSPPLVAGDRVYVAERGVRDVQCIELSSGRLIWRAALPAPRRMLGFAGDRLLLQSETGLMARSSADGKTLWQHPIPTSPAPGPPLAGLLDAIWLPTKSMLLAAKKAPAGDDKNFVPTLVWIDPATGHEAFLAPLASLKHERPRFGPLALVEGRLFALSGHGEQEAQRDIVELVAEGAAWQGASEKQADLGPWRRGADAALVEATNCVFPKWTLLGGANERKQPSLIAEWQGETMVLEAQAVSGRPFSLARRGLVPAGSPKLVIRVASDAKWKLEALAGEKIIASQTLDRESTGGGWKTIELNLDPVAGQTAWLVVRQIDIDGSRPVVKWKTLEIRD